MAKHSQKWLNTIYYLIPFTRNYNERMTGSEIARYMKCPQRTIARHLEILHSKGILKSRELGNRKEYYIDLNNPISNNILNLIETTKAIEFISQNMKINILVQEFLKYGTVVIFGSFAKKQTNLDSDIDILFIGKKSRGVEKIVMRSPMKLHIQYSTVKNLITLLNNKNALANEIKRNHIIFGDVDMLIEVFKNE